MRLVQDSGLQGQGLFPAKVDTKPATAAAGTDEDEMFSVAVLPALQRAGGAHAGTGRATIAIFIGADAVVIGKKQMPFSPRIPGQQCQGRMQQTISGRGLFFLMAVGGRFFPSRGGKR